MDRARAAIARSECRAWAALPGLVAAVVVAAGAAVADEGGPRVTVAWKGLPLVDVCERLATLARRPVLLDRRIDPEVAVSLEAAGEPIERVLSRLAADHRLGCVVTEGSIRVVPRDRVAAVVEADRARRAAVARLPRGVRATAEEAEEWRWSDGAVPRAILEEAAAGARVTLEGLERVPHDHLRGASLPSLPLAERLDAVLLQFDRRIDWSAARRDGRSLVAPIVPLAPAASAADAPALAVAAGAWKPTAGPPGGTPGEATWSLQVAAPLDTLVATVAERLGLRAALDREGLAAAGIAPGEIVRVRVDDATRDELLDAIVAPLGLAWSIDDGTLSVGPATAAAETTPGG